MLKYNVEEKPGLSRIPWLSLQHVLAMLGATIAVPTIVAGGFGLNSEQTSLFISNVLLCMGIATLLQTLLGSRLPIIQGSSFAFLPALLYLGSQVPGTLGLQYAAGAIIIGGVLQASLGLSRVAGLLQGILTPVVIGPTIVVIGLSLFKVGAQQASTNWLVSLATIALVFAFSFSIGSRKVPGRALKGLENIRLYPIALTILIVWGACLVLSLLDFIPATNPAYVDLSTMMYSGLYRTQQLIFPWGAPKFDLAFFVIFVVAYLVSVVESIGDYNAVSGIINDSASSLSSDVINKGVTAEGAGCIIAGALGGAPTTSYSENIGLIGITGVASRIVVVGAGALLVIAGLLPVVGGVLGSIPIPLMGGLYCVLFGIITGVGLRYVALADLGSMRNVSIMGFSIFFGFAVPEAFTDVVLEVRMQEMIGRSLTDTVMGIAKSSMAVTAIVSLLLDRLLPTEG